MSERTRDGLEAARARGRTGGQKPKLGPRQARLAREMYDSGNYTVEEIEAEFGVTRPTVYWHLARTPTPETAATDDGRGHVGNGHEHLEDLRNRVALDEVLADLPTDARPLPAVAAYDDLLPGRTAGR